MGNGQLSLFLLYAFLCQLFGFSSSLFHSCPKDQALVLLQFKHMFTITPYVSYCYYKTTNKNIVSYPKTVTWNTSVDCCSWAGVYCDETTGQVIELDLSCSQLQGKFHPNSSLFQLSNLKRLDLSRNDFSQSHISPKFSEFSSLMYLDLSDSNMSGPIPPEISHLSKLRVLRITRDNAHDQDGLRLGPHNFKLLVKNLTKLRDLDLFLVNISSTIPLNFSSFLTSLQLFGTQLFGIFPERVFHLSNLKYLSLSSNPHLTIRFPTTKWNSSESLMELYLDGVNLIDKIPQSFSYLTSLRQLDMRSCNLSGYIPRPLWNLTNVEGLILDNNHFEGPISLFILGKLKFLSLRNNNFEFLSFNGSWNSQLESLDISSNSLTGSIPYDVSGLQNLRDLYLSSNHLNGTIPSWIFAVPSLEWLDLSNNIFSGKIQEFTSKTLSYVSVQDNQMQGPIPKSLLNQPRLDSLSLSQNNLSGQISSTICKLKTLSILDLGSNKLEGPIPQCLGEMSVLQLFDVSNNSLSGTINTTFSIGNQLQVINFDMNKLEGKVPPSLINCKYLRQLDLGNNVFNDTFPKFLGALPDLQILSLRSNKLQGPIKISRTENVFSQLRILDLSSNGFSGKLPTSLFENFQAMKIINENMTRLILGFLNDSLTITTKGLNLQFLEVLEENVVIDLSNNRFEGYIPSIIGDLIRLRTLNLSHNNLKGHIPTSLHQLSLVESLDLSFNRINGGIPQQLASLPFLEVLNLSHNHLIGCIPRGKQFDTFENSSYTGNDGLRGFPLSKDCGADDGVPQAATQFGLDQEEEGDSSMINWQAVLIGYGFGLVTVLSAIYIMLATQYPAWFSRLFEELVHKIITRMQKHRKIT